MKMKLFFAAAAFLFSGVAVAQYEGTRLDDRIGTGEDSLRTRQNMHFFQEAISSSNWTEAYEAWKPIIEKAPFANLSIYADGAYMLANLILSEQDVEKKRTYFTELMNLYDLRLKNLQGLNSFQRTERTKATRGDVLARKADDYFRYGPTCDPTFTYKKCYNMYTEGINLIKEEGGREVAGYVLQDFFIVSDALYKQDNNGFREQYLNDYLSSRDICVNMMQLAKEETDSVRARKIVDMYDAPYNTIETLFAQSKAADRDQIVAIFTPKIEANKNDLAYLKSALAVMAANDCDDTPIYYKAAEYAYNIEPTYESAIGTAQRYSSEGKVTESLKYYNKAIELCSTDKLRGQIALKVAQALRKSGDYNSAFNYLNKATEYNPDLQGMCHMQRASIAIKQKNYSDAKSYCDKAAAADITLAGQASRLKSNIQTVEAHNAEYLRQKAAYDKQEAERKAEEDFWKGK